MPETVIVVPCFNEERRLPAADLLALARAPGLRVLFVDDGSTDGTGAVLRRLSALGEGRIDVLTLAANSGKGEAVRQGLLRALSLEPRADAVGYLDADLSTPLDEVLRLVDELDRGEARVVLGSRVARLGADIDRRTVRHYLGRVFATGASLLLGIAVYDTQCGAKLFRRTPELEGAVARPFLSRWAFDVELLGRLLSAYGGPEGFLEIPLRRWRDVPGSKLRLRAMARAAADLVRLRTELTVRRRR